MTQINDAETGGQQMTQLVRGVARGAVKELVKEAITEAEQERRSESASGRAFGSVLLLLIGTVIGYVFATTEPERLAEELDIEPEDLDVGEVATEPLQSKESEMSEESESSGLRKKVPGAAAVVGTVLLVGLALKKRGGSEEGELGTEALDFGSSSEEEGEEGQEQEEGAEGTEDEETEE